MITLSRLKGLIYRATHNTYSAEIYRCGESSVVGLSIARIPIWKCTKSAIQLEFYKNQDDMTSDGGSRYGHCIHIKNIERVR